MNREVEIKEYSSNRKCQCSPMCIEHYKVDGFDVYCKKHLENLAFTILNKLNGINIMQGNYKNNGWTTRQEEMVIRYIDKYGVQNGTYAKLGLIVNKNRNQVKGKVYQLEKQGRLTFKRVESKKAASDAAFKNKEEMK